MTDKVTFILDKCLDEQFSHWLPLYPSALQLFKLLLTRSIGRKHQLNSRLLLLYNLTRGVYVFSSTPEVVDDLIVTLSLLLYDTCLDTSHGSQLTLPSAIETTINFPISVISSTSASVQDQFLTDNQEQILLLKVYWNLAWFGGIHIISQWTEPKGDARFSPKLMLSQEELCLVKESFSEAIIEDIILRLNKFRTHRELSDALHSAILHLTLLEDNVEKYDWVMTLPWIQGLSRFLRITPTSRNDEKLFLVSEF